MLTIELKKILIQIEKVLVTINLNWKFKFLSLMRLAPFVMV